MGEIDEKAYRFLKRYAFSLYDGHAVSLWWKSTRGVVADEPQSNSQGLYRKVQARRRDILVICADGLTGMKEAVNAAFPQTELQRCIVHHVRNTLKYVGEKNKKEFANDLKTIYHAPSEDAALEALERVTEKWEDDYPSA